MEKRAEAVLTAQTFVCRKEASNTRNVAPNCSSIAENQYLYVLWVIQHTAFGISSVYLYEHNGG